MKNDGIKNPVGSGPPKAPSGYKFGGNAGRVREKTDLANGTPCHKTTGPGNAHKPSGQKG